MKHHLIFFGLIGAALMSAAALPLPVAFNGAAGGDPYFSSVVLLLHANGANTSTTFADSSSLNKTSTAVGNAQQATAQFKFGTASYLGDGTGDYLTEDGSSSFAFGTGDFTIEFWLRLNTTGSWSDLYDSRGNASFDLAPVLSTSGSRVLIYTTAATTRITGTTTLSTNTWHHVAVSRSGTNTKLFLNGVQESTTYTDSTTYIIGASRPTIGASGYSVANSLNGYIDDLRVTKGVARYTNTFTPPAAQFPDN